MDTGVFVFHTVLEGCLGAIFLARGSYPKEEQDQLSLAAIATRKRRVRLHACSLLGLATVGGLVLARGTVKQEEGVLAAKSLFAFHGLATAVTAYGLTDGSTPSVVGVLLSPSFLMALGFGSMVLKAWK